MRRLGLMSSLILLILLVCPLKADKQMCISNSGPDFDCTFCSPGQNGMVKHGGFVYECVNGVHQGGPVACITRISEKESKEEHIIIPKNRRGFYTLRQVANCQPDELLQIKCLIAPEQTCINPKQRYCMSFKGVRMPLGTGIEEDGLHFFCSIRRYTYRLEAGKNTDMNVAFLWDCRFDKEDYEKSIARLNELVHIYETRIRYPNVWNHYCQKGESKFILPVETSFEFLKQIQCTYDSLERTGKRTMKMQTYTIPSGEWRVVYPMLNVSCSAGAIKIENCVTDLGTPVALGTSFEEMDAPDGPFVTKYTCADDQSFDNMKMEVQDLK